ncbi:hypothetical protein GDO81_022262 [Engystomops pustulosus]|uniref:Uncharacterized protein n=1 Tax=Engystomops pustulosus TaxID=76066 RepID=A0AAV6ZE71_ENGPU|nr:hypothetical protein GDO81_022262 [Engystomops pustulosus]
MEVEILGLTDDVDTDFLILYLESKRRSGGGPVTSFTRTGNQALVTFENLSGFCMPHTRFTQSPETSEDCFILWT